MKKIFTLLAVMLTALTASADNVTTDLELVGSNLTLPPKYITGRAEFQNFQKWGEVMFFDKEQSDGKTTSPYEIYMEEWPILHVEFEKLVPNVQFHFQGDAAKYLPIEDPEVLTYDVDIRERGLDFDTPVTLIALQSTEKQEEAVIIKECYLTNEDGDKMYLYYSVNNSGGWGVKIVGESKLLSGKVEFMAETWAQLGGAGWAPADLLKNATNAIWTIELADAVATDQLQLIIDADKTYYLGEFIQPGATTLVYDANAYHAESAYSPELASTITSLRIQVKGKLDEPVYLNVKSVTLTVEGVSTGINTAKAAAADSNATIYNMSGQRVTTLTKGLYIQNGRKFVVK